MQTKEGSATNPVLQFFELHCSLPGPKKKKSGPAGSYHFIIQRLRENTYKLLRFYKKVLLFKVVPIVPFSPNLDYFCALISWDRSSIQIGALLGSN